MATAGQQPEALSFGMERILRLDSPPAPRKDDADSSRDSSAGSRWPPAPLLPLPSAAGLPCSTAAALSPGRTAAAAPQSSECPPLLSLRAPHLYSFCAPPPPPLVSYLPLSGRAGEPVGRLCTSCPQLWPAPCHHHHHHLLHAADSRYPSSLVAGGRRAEVRRKRTWTRAVFTNLQRKGLEKRFTVQRYITKPERRKLADTLGLTDSQVKVWFQNRRMKWRNSRQAAERAAEEAPAADSTQPSADDDAGQPINVED